MFDQYPGNRKMLPLTIKEIVQKVNDSELASVKSIITGIVRLLGDPNSTIKDIKEIILIDPPLLSKVLKLANSSYYAPSQPIEEIDKALVMIGFDAVMELALNQKACEVFSNTDKTENYSAAHLWENNVAVALFSKYLYRREFADKGETAYIAGILHNFGIIALDQYAHDNFVEIIKECENLQENLDTIERNRFGFTHAELGGAIISDWKIPDYITAAIKQHHDPQNTDNSDSKLANVLFIADYFCAHRKIGYFDAPFQPKEKFIESIKTLNISPESFKLIGKDVEVEIKRMKENGLL